MLHESFFKNKRITVFGLGLNMGGIGTVKFLAEHGAREIIVTDIKKREELKSSLDLLTKYKNITYVLGQHRPEDFTRTDMVIKNPVIPWTNEYVRLAEKNGVPVEMDSSLFFSFCKAPIIGITGTKGKTTTSLLVAHILEKAGKKVVRAGIGQVGVLSLLDSIVPTDTVVFELSSWRLSAIGKKKHSPRIAVLTNIHPDHLNYYRSMEGYVADKTHIFLHQRADDILIANFDNEGVRTMAQDAPGRIMWFTEQDRAVLPGDGLFMREGKVWLALPDSEQEVFALTDIPLEGKHNIGNALAAACAAIVSGVAVKQVRTGISSFPGVPHRLECVGQKNGVRYYNDTAATIPEAAIAGIQSFKEPVILITGGTDKHLEFGALAETIYQHTKGVVFFQGNATEKLLAALKSRIPETKQWAVVDSMAKAVELASLEAEPGDVVLLSPGAASFGLFKNEFDRGEQFRKAVAEL